MKKLLVIPWLSAIIGLCTSIPTSQVLASTVYTITNGSISEVGNPIAREQSASDYYNYIYPSGNPGFGTESDTRFFWLYKNTYDGSISLGMIFDTPRDIGGGTADMTISGVPITGFIDVVHDPPPSRDKFTLTGDTWIWNASSTDGGVIGGLDGLWEIAIALDSSTGVDQWYFLNGPLAYNPESVSLDMTEKLVVNAVPTPGAIWLLGSGLIGLLGIRGRFALR